MLESSYFQRLLSELRRRRVLRVAAIYAAVAWLIIQVAETAFPHLALPSWTITLVIVLLLVGFPLALVLGWAYDLTPDGVARTPPLEAAAPPHPGGRWRRAVVMTAGLSALAVGGYLSLTRGAGADREPDAQSFHSIAVLPFVNMSTDPDNEYFSDGLTEELLNLLAQVEGLRVAARTSAFAFKGVGMDVTEIGRRLNVEKVLEGSVRKTGNRLRVTAQLINVSDGYHEWSATFDQMETADIFAIQDSISRAIVTRLIPQAAPPQADTHGGTTDLAAYEEFLKGRYAFWGGTSESNLRTAITHYEAALERDPAYALAWAGLADAFMLLGGQHALPIEVFPRARAAAVRALEIDDQLAEGYVALASINWFFEWDWGAAERNYRRSFSVNRNIYTRCICYAWYLVVVGDAEAAVREAERARALDPLSQLPLTTLAQMYFLAGRHEDARSVLDTLQRSGSTSAVLPRLRAWIDWDAGRTAEAVETLEQYRASFDGRFAIAAPPIAVAELAYMYARVGRTGDAASLAAALRQRATERYVPAEYLAVTSAAAGDRAAAERWIETAHSQRSNLAMFSTYPISRALHDLPAYRRTLARIGVPSAAPRNLNSE